MSPVDRLVFHPPIPPAIEQEHVFAKLQVQDDAAGAIAHQDDMLRFVFLESLQNCVALFGGNLSVIFKWPEAAKLVRQNLDALDPLAEDDRLLAAGGDFLHIAHQPLSL